MPRHRSLTLRKFVSAIDHGLMERYFTEKLPKDADLPFRIIMDYPAIEEFMADSRNAEAKGLVLQDFRKINDLCEKGKNLLVKTYDRYDIPWDKRDNAENLAMKLFLDHKDEFDYAYTWYSYYHASSKMSHHLIPGDFKLTEKKLESFLAETEEWFKDLAKGPKCIITHYDEEDSTVILIKHGSYVRTVAYWKEDKIEIQSFRPASEDILLYNKEMEILSIKASLPKDREQYIKLFCRCIMDDESLAESGERDTIYTLKPLQDGSFNWDGNESIKKVILTEVILKLSGSSEPVVKINSKDVRKSLSESFSDIGLDAGELTYAHFRFILDLDGKRQKVSFMIAPPDVSDLAQKKHSEIISDYLKEQKVKLI
jgi:hypothetical protein